MTYTIEILENVLKQTEQEILVAGIEFAAAQQATKSINPFNMVAVTEARNAVDAASAKLGQAYDRLINVRHALISAKAAA